MPLRLLLGVDVGDEVSDLNVLLVIGWLCMIDLTVLLGMRGWVLGMVIWDLSVLDSYEGAGILERLVVPMEECIDL